MSDFSACDGKLKVTMKGKKTAQMEILGPIGPSLWGMIDDKAVLNALKEMDDGVEEIHVLVNSPGGAAFTGLSVYNVLKRHEAKVIMEVTGIAASAASVVILAGDEVLMHPGTMIMIHEGETIAFGPVEAFREVADVLEKVNTQIADLYVKHTGNSLKQVKEWMSIGKTNMGTWFSAEEAVENGFADKVVEDGSEEEPTNETLANVQSSLQWLGGPPQGSERVQNITKLAMSFKRETEGEPETVEEPKVEDGIWLRNLRKRQQAMKEADLQAMRQETNQMRGQDDGTNSD